jgi:hypothetical protein
MTFGVESNRYFPRLVVGIAMCNMQEENVRTRVE